MKVLAGDVGGTRTRLAVVELRGGEARVSHRKEFRSADHDGLEPVVRRYLESLADLEEVSSISERAAFGVACPVFEGVCRLPNLDWEIDQRRLADSLGLSGTVLLNDFDAVCHALPFLGPDDTVVLQPGAGPDEPGTAGPSGVSTPRAVVGAGTGLGVAFVTGSGEQARVHSSEGGHVDFAPRDRLEFELTEHLGKRYGRVSSERVLSGPGLVELYRFLIAAGYEEETEETRRAMEREDPAAVISRRALASADAACEAALDRFVSIYGAQVGNFALAFEARAGVYVAGGIAPRILDRLRDGPFLEAFRDKGRFRSYMEKIPVEVIVDPDVGLVGAAAAGAERAGGTSTSGGGAEREPGAD